MDWIGITAVCLAAFIIVMVAAPAIASGWFRDETLTGGIRVLASMVFVLGFIIGTGFFSIHNTGDKEIGVVRSFGKVSGQTHKGLNVLAPWLDVETWNARYQSVKPDTSCDNGKTECMEAGSVDNQVVYIKTALNLSISPNDIQELARTIDKDAYRSSIVMPRYNQVVKEVISSYKAENILASRPTIRSQIRDGLTKELAPFSISVDDVSIVDVDFTDDFNEAIAKKVAAAVEADTERNRVETEKARADQKIEEARGTATANSLISASITPTLVQWEAINKLAPNVSVALIPSLSQMILPGDILQPATAATR